MKQYDKEILLCDLCSRLPYGTKVLCTEISTKTVYKLEGVCVYYRDVPIVHLRDQGLINMPIMYIRPYLFPLSSMTEEQKIELACIIDSDYAQIDWYNKNHFDYRGLISKGLAIDATGLNIY